MKLSSANSLEVSSSNSPLNLASWVLSLICRLPKLMLGFSISCWDALTPERRNTDSMRAVTSPREKGLTM